MGTICKNKAKEVSDITVKPLVKDDYFKELSSAIEDISEKMDSLCCDCEHQNPSGKCCLKDVKEIIKLHL